MENECEAARLEQEALMIEGDSDNPLRVNAANELWDRAAKLRGQPATPTDPGIIGDDGLDTYDAGLLGDGGGGDVDWWQDYIRVELERADEHYRQQHDAVVEALTLKLAEAERLSKHNETLATVYQDKANEAERVLADKDKWIGELVCAIQRIIREDQVTVVSGNSLHVGDGKFASIARAALANKEDRHAG